MPKDAYGSRVNIVQVAHPLPAAPRFNWTFPLISRLPGDFPSFGSFYVCLTDSAALMTNAGG